MQMNFVRTKKIIYILISIVLLIALNYLFYTYWHKSNSDWRVLESKVKKEIVQFKGKVGLVIKDLKSDKDIIYERDKLFPSASLVKIPIMASCFLAAQEGQINLTQKVLLRPEDKVYGSGKLKNISSQQILTVEELIELMITESDNTATNALIDLLGFEYLNNSFKKLGLSNTNLSRKMMDFTNRKNGVENLTSASDIALLLEKIYRKKLLSAPISNKCLGLLKLQKIRDRIPALLPKTTIVAHKTGLERGICHDAGIVFTDQGNFLICVLVSHRNKTARPAKKFIAQIAFLTYNCYQNQ